MTFSRMRLLDGSGYSFALGALHLPPDGLIHHVHSWHKGESCPEFTLASPQRIYEVARTEPEMLWAAIACTVHTFRAIPVGNHELVTCLACIAGAR